MSSHPVTIEYPDWLLAEPDLRKRIVLIFDAMVRCMISDHSMSTETCGPHMTATMGLVFVQKILDEMLAIQEHESV